MKKEFVCQEDFGSKILGALPIIVWEVYRDGYFFDKSIHLLVN